MRLAASPGFRERGTQPRSQGVLTSYADHEARSQMNTMVHFDEMRPESGCIWKPLWIARFLGNANQRKMAVALALILHKIN